MDQIKASTDRNPHFSQDKEAFTMLDLNDAAVRFGKGKFYYLPESTEPVKVRKQKHEAVVMKSVVPRLLYVHHEWAEHDRDNYWKQKTDKDRYKLIQDRILAELSQVDVMPINLVLQTPGMPSLSWPSGSLAVIAIYGPGPWYKLSWMSEWTDRAIASKVGDRYTASMYRPGTTGGTKANFSLSVNALGRISGVEEIPSRLRIMMRLNMEDHIKLEEISSHLSVAEQRSVHESKACSWVAGNEILRLLALEAM